MEKINLVELLKDCPKGMELDCTLYEDVYFDGIAENTSFPIAVSINCDGEIWTKGMNLTNEGKLGNHPNAKCVIFPKGKTTWDGFVPPCKFKDGDIVSTGGGSYIYILNGEATREEDCYKGKYKGKVYFGYYTDTNKTINSNIPWYFSRFATEEEKQKLFQAIKDNGYRWNAETKDLEKLIEPKFKVGDRIKSIISSSYYTVVDIKNDQYFIKSDTEKYPYQVPFSYEINYKLVPNKFDITTLKPFDKVLVRGSVGQKWVIDFFGFMDNDKGFPFVCVGHHVTQCIPYEGNEHLLGKVDDCNEFYKTWE